MSSYLPGIENEVQAQGALYVLEGSTLGGRGITKMLLRQCPWLTLQKLTFFNGYGAGTGPMWLSFHTAFKTAKRDREAACKTAAAELIKI